MLDTALSLIYQVAILFLLMLPGIILIKKKLVPDTFGKGLSGFVLYIAQPCLVFLAYLRPYDPKVLDGVLWVLLFSVLAHLVFVSVALLVFRRAPGEKRKMLHMATIFSNAAFMGLPLIEVLLGGEALLYATIYNITFNLVLWSLGVYLCTYDKDLNDDGEQTVEEHSTVRRQALRSVGFALIHPVTIASFLGLLFFFLPIHEYVPALLTDTFGMLKSTVAPLSMVVIGLRLATTSFGGLWRDKYLYIFLALRHVLLPLCVLALLRGAATLFPSLSETVIQVVVILASAPAASSATMFAERYGCDAGYVGKLVTVSTALSILTMPPLLLLASL